MSSNKELVEKMYHKLVGGDVAIHTSYKMAEELAAVASEHYGDKWDNIEDVKPPIIQHNPCYYVHKGVVYEGHYCFASGVFWFYNGKGSYCHQSEITHYKIKLLPQPPQQ